MEKFQVSFDVLARKVPSRFLMIIVFFIMVQSSGLSQQLDSLLAGNWFEVHKKVRTSAIPLQVQLKKDSAANYINLYPERSYNLKWFVTSDSILRFSNGDRYKILSVGAGFIKMKKGTGPGAKMIVLKRGNKF